MAIKINDGLEIAAYNPIDTRIVLTKAEMLTIIGDDAPSTTAGDHCMPERYFAFCSDDNSWYLFNYYATQSSETGKFVKLKNSEVTKATSGTDSEMSTVLATAKIGDKFINTEDGKTYRADIDVAKVMAWFVDTPVAGAIVFDSKYNKLKYFNGTEWKEVGSGSGGGGIEDVTVLPTVPDTAVIYRLPDGSLNVNNGTYWSKLSVSDSEGGFPITKEVSATPTTYTDGVIYAVCNSEGEQFKIHQNGSWYELSLSWYGTQAEYDALTNKNPSTTYYITD